MLHVLGHDGKSMGREIMRREESFAYSVMGRGRDKIAHTIS